MPSHRSIVPLCALVLFGLACSSQPPVDVVSGQERWRYEPEGVSLVSAEFGFDRKSIISSPSVVDGTVYVGSRDGHMYALDQRTGAFKWRADHQMSWAMSSPAVVDGEVYSGTSDGTFVHALDGGSGAELWRFVAEGYTWSSPAVTTQGVYIGDAGGNVWALDRATGTVRWSYRARGGLGPVVRRAGGNGLRDAVSPAGVVRGVAEDPVDGRVRGDGGRGVR